MAQPPKRKQPPDSVPSSQRGSGNGRGTKRQKVFQDARAILTQTSDAALNNGELDLHAFLKAREYEIKALENGIRKSKASRNERAFQSVPRDMRRRTASHNVKRVPKRLQKRANKEMKEDNTPTVTPNKRKPGSSRGRLRAETAKRLGLLAAKKKAAKGGAVTGIVTRAARPKIRTDKLNDPPKPGAKFRKRQTNKTWLPTHLWHAKRATMTEPKNPLWRFAMPITSTEKSYRPTHTASRLRGAVAWDTSYMSTIRLEGPIESLQKVFQGVGISQPGIWETKGEKWRAGKRSWSEWLSREVQGQRVPIGPATVVWCADEQDASTGQDIAASKETKRPTRQVFVRLHPSAFLETWSELLRLSKQQRPVVRIEDLRWEIGSIEMTGPGSTEALLGILHPYSNPDGSLEAHGKVFTSLAGVTNSASLPINSLLSFSIMDPRLHYPPQPLTLPCDQDALLRTLSSWPADDASPAPSGLFDRDRRFKATRLPSQKALNRRKNLAPEGERVPILPTDPRIPIILLASRPATSSSAQGNWILLAPWKCILPVWHGLVHFPLSTGGNPRFGGLDEIRQVHFENGIPWFPADFPGTNAGYMWEMEQRAKRKKDWDSRPKGKRIEWESLDLGAGRKGEIGLGWSCDFEKLLGLSVPDSLPVPIDQNISQEAKDETLPQPEPLLRHLPGKDFTPLLSKPFDLPAPNAVSTIRIALVSRGVVTPCARIYRLPRLTESSPSTESTTASFLPLDLRQQWVSLLTPPASAKNHKRSKASRIPPNTPHPQRVRLLAESLLNAPAPYPPTAKEDEHPLVPNEEDLIGFITTGQYNLSVGNATAIGTVLAAKVVEGLKRDGKGKGGREAWLCIIRNAGEKIGRLGKWEVV